MSKIQYGVMVALLAALVGIEASKIAFPDRLGPRWEYEIEGVSDANFDTAMEHLGGNGWELVFARRAMDDGTKKPSYEMIFKRPK